MRIYTEEKLQDMWAKVVKEAQEDGAVYALYVKALEQPDQRRRAQEVGQYLDTLREHRGQGAIGIFFTYLCGAVAEYLLEEWKGAN